jgi:hypothetical protein
MRRAGRLLVGFVILTVTSPAHAQALPSLDLRTYRPSIDPEANLVVEPVTTPGSRRWSVAALAQYAYRPVELSGLFAPPHLVDHLVGTDLVAQVGLGSRAQLGFDLPVFVWQDGASGLASRFVTDDAVPHPPWFSTSGAVPRSGFGDFAFAGKLTVASNDHKGVRSGFGLAVAATVSLPTGNRESFQGDGDLTGTARVLVEYAIGPAALRASAGYFVRAKEHAWPGPLPPAPDNILQPSYVGPTFGSAIPWSLGAVLRPKAVFPTLDKDDRQSWEIAAHGALPAGPVAPFVGAGASLLSPALLAIDNRVELGHYHDAYVLAGGEVGLDDAVGVPVVRAVLGIGWAPRNHDQDDDGVPDDRDECPDLPEDRDGIQDSDGCPEDDADSDGVLDAEDACPTTPGPASTNPKMNGCPAR